MVSLLCMFSFFFSPFVDTLLDALRLRRDNAFAERSAAFTPSRRQKDD